jgi:hypothetical protein
MMFQAKLKIRGASILSPESVNVKLVLRDKA